MEEKIAEIENTNIPSEPSEPKNSGISAKFPKIPRPVLICLAVFVVLTIVLGVLVGLPLTKAYQDGRTAYASALAIKDAAKSQDIKKTADAILSTQNQVHLVQSDLKLVSWTTFIPFLGAYTSDALHLASAADHGLEAAKIIVSAVEPYADILGLKGQGTFAGGTAEDRMAKMVETFDKVTPQIDSLASQLDIVRQNVDAIDPNRYPQSLAGKVIRPRILEFKQLVDLSDSLLTEARPMVKQIPDLLGIKEERKYLVLFQNDKELRPTGGFITAYAVFRVEKGRIHLETSDDIYKLDDTVTLHVAPPDPIAKYLNVYGWRLRDSNFSPDFASSMKSFEDLYASSTDKKKIDGILAVDTEVLLRMMDVLGPIAAYGTNFTTKTVPECNCPMVIYELEKYADEPKGYERGSRKDIIGVLLSEILKKTLASPRQIYSQIFQVGWDQARQKHILVYLNNPDAQKGVEAVGFAGRIKNPTTDYLHINDANLGGAKSNLFLTSKVTQEISQSGGKEDVTLTIEYRYPHQADNCSLERKQGLCLAGIYRDYQRIYLPSGAQLVSADGYESKTETYQDLGHQVVAGFFTLVPQGLKQIKVKYQLPSTFVNSQSQYQSLIQKQPGTLPIHYKITVNNQTTEFDLSEDKDLSLKM